MNTPTVPDTDLVSAGPDIWGTSQPATDRTPEQTVADEFAAGLTAIGEFFRANPDLMRHMPGYWRRISVYVHRSTPSPRSVIGEFVAAGRAAGIDMSERSDANYGGVELDFSGALLKLWTNREDLGDQPPPPPVTYRPLLGDTAPAGA